MDELITSKLGWTSHRCQQLSLKMGKRVGHLDWNFRDAAWLPGKSMVQPGLRTLVQIILGGSRTWPLNCIELFNRKIMGVS